VKAILAVALALACAPATGADQGPELALGKDPKAAQQVIERADTAEPLMLVVAGAALVEQGRVDEGIFWFYAGQLRGRYWEKLQGENAQILTIFVITVGEQVNARAYKDIPALLKTLDAVAAWDEKTFATWASAMNLDPADPAMLERRRKAIEGLEPYKKMLVTERKRLEQYAATYKTPAQLDRDRQDVIDKSYSKEPVEFGVAGTRFRVPVNHLSPHGALVKSGLQFTNTELWIFLPDFDGYTRDNWREPLANEDAILIKVNAGHWKNPEAQVEAFLAEGGAAVERVGSLDVTIYQAGKTRAPLPVIGTSRHYVLKGAKAGGGSYYVVCDAPQGYIQKVPRCEMFLGDAARGLHASALFGRAHLQRVAEIEQRLSSMLASWVVD
jgi:hypothetical protein